MARKTIQSIISILIFVALVSGQVSDRPILEDTEVETTIKIKMISKAQMQLIIDSLVERLAELEEESLDYEDRITALERRVE